MQIDKYHDTNDLANLASVVIKLNTDLNAMRALLAQCDAERQEVVRERDSLKRLVEALGHKLDSVQASLDKYTHGDTLEIEAQEVPAASVNPEFPDVDR